MAATAFFTKPESSPARERLYAELDQQNAAPLWEVLAGLVPSTPQSGCVPAVWRYADMRPLLMQAGRVISTPEAERRVLVLENPGFRGKSTVTSSLYAGLQMVLPGEIAPCHRHSASALRFVIEGHSGYTAVDGERTTMHPGDFIVTPSWTYHDHGNPGDKPVIWLDGLDAPIVNMLDATFAEHYPDDDSQPVRRRDGDADARYGSNLMPLEYEPSRGATPLFTYPYARSRETLDRVFRNGPIDSSHGVKMQYTNPATGGYPMPAIAAFLQLLPAGFRGEPYRATDATIFAVVEGRGRSRIGATTVTWEPHDIFVVPSWQPVSHDVSGEAVLFSFSDRPVQKALGVWREAPG